MCRLPGVFTVQNVVVKLLNCQGASAAGSVWNSTTGAWLWGLFSVTSSLETGVNPYCISDISALVHLKSCQLTKAVKTKHVADQTRWHIRSSTVQLFASGWEFHLDLLDLAMISGSPSTTALSLTQMNLQTPTTTEDTTLLDFAVNSFTSATGCACVFFDPFASTISAYKPTILLPIRNQIPQSKTKPKSSRSVGSSWTPKKTWAEL